MSEPRIGVVGATGAVGTVTLQLLADRGYGDVRAFASARSAGTRVPFGDRELDVEEATPAALGAGDLDLCLFSVGTTASRELVPHAAAAGAACVDKSSAYRLVDGYPLVVPEVNGARALEALDHDRIVANPNCCTIPLTCVLKPLHEQPGSVASASPRISPCPAPARGAWSSSVASPSPSTTCSWTGRGRATSPTRRPSSATRRARSWSSRICRSLRPVSVCP